MAPPDLHDVIGRRSKSKAAHASNRKNTGQSQHKALAAADGITQDAPHDSFELRVLKHLANYQDDTTNENSSCHAQHNIEARASSHAETCKTQARRDIHDEIDGCWF